MIRPTLPNWGIVCLNWFHILSQHNVNKQWDVFNSLLESEIDKWIPSYDCKLDLRHINMTPINYT